MIFMLSIEQARKVAGVAKAASNDTGRPLLQQIQVSWRTVEEKLVVAFVATNSYLMVRRTVTVEGAEGPKAGEALVPAKAFGKALKEAAAAAKKQLSKTKVGVGLDDDERKIEVVTYPTEDYATMIRMEMTPKQNKYPEVESIFGERAHNYEGGLPAFNPLYLKQLMDSISSTPSDIHYLPARWFAAKGKKGELAAWGFRVEDKTNATDFEGLLMPVRL